MKLWQYLAVPVTLVAMMSLASANAHDDSVDRLRDAGAVLKQIMDAPDKGIPEEVFDNAKCVVVVPNLVKGGFIVGGKDRLGECV